MKHIVIIPARYASTRFPGKPLALLGGKPIVQWAYETVAQVFDYVYVATDDERIRLAVEAFGGKAVMTRSDHKSGTDRICEAVEKLGFAEADDIVFNVQGDEPFIKISQLFVLGSQFVDLQATIATLGTPFKDMAAVDNPNSPKIVTDNNGYALYFSRSAIPFVRGTDHGQWLEKFPFLKHIGIYAFRYHTLREITQLPQSPLELAESLEQLRWLQNGYRIRVGITSEETVGIDTPEDLARAEAMLAAGNQ